MFEVKKKNFLYTWCPNLHFTRHINIKPKSQPNILYPSKKVSGASLKFMVPILQWTQQQKINCLMGSVSDFVKLQGKVLGQRQISHHKKLMNKSKK
jgi:hypothetical protein